MFEITVHIPALDRLAEAVIAATAGGAVPSAKPAAKPASKPAGKASKPAEKAADPEPEPKEEGADFSALRDEATKVLQDLNKANGIDAVRSALAEFGVTKISEVEDGDLEQALSVFQSKLG